MGHESVSTERGKVDRASSLKASVEVFLEKEGKGIVSTE